MNLVIWLLMTFMNILGCLSKDPFEPIEPGFQPIGEVTSKSTIIVVLKLNNTKIRNYTDRAREPIEDLIFNSNPELPRSRYLQSIIKKTLGTLEDIEGRDEDLVNLISNEQDIDHDGHHVQKFYGPAEESHRRFTAKISAI